MGERRAETSQGGVTEGSDWFALRQNTRCGPMKRRTLDQRAARGELESTDLVYDPQHRAWRFAAEIEGLPLRPAVDISEMIAATIAEQSPEIANVTPIETEAVDGSPADDTTLTDASWRPLCPPRRRRVATWLWLVLVLTSLLAAVVAGVSS